MPAFAESVAAELSPSAITKIASPRRLGAAAEAAMAAFANQSAAVRGFDGAAFNAARDLIRPQRMRISKALAVSAFPCGT
jgi:hypothetical protein